MSDNTERPVADMEEDSHQELQNPSRSLGLRDALYTSDLAFACPTTFLTHLGKQDMKLPKMSTLMVLCRQTVDTMGSISMPEVTHNLSFVTITVQPLRIYSSREST